MAGDIQPFEVDDLIATGKLLIGDGYRAKNNELGASGLPFARAGNINDGFRFEDADRFPRDDIQRVGNKVSQPGDVVFTSKGTVGRFALVGPTTEPFVYSPQLCFWRSFDHALIEPRFLYYWMYGREFYLQYKGVAGQTDMAEYVSLTDQRRMHISLPEIGEQRAIARILGALDDKIELNRKTNATLEAMARALFKSWFIDFDPVRAKAAGRAPSGMAPETTKLFPSEFVNSELGPIPKGWSVASIGDVAEIVGGSTPSTKEPAYWDDGVHHWATPKDLSALATPVIAMTERKITDEGLRQISSGLLPVGTVLLSSRAPIGYLGIAEVPLAVNQGFIAMKAQPGVTAQFLLRWAEAAHEEIVSRANGSTFLEISKSNFRPIKLVCPSAPVLDAFNVLADGLYRRVVTNEQQARSLTRTRDELLPRLLSGTLDVGPLVDAQGTSDG